MLRRAALLLCILMLLVSATPAPPRLTAPATLTHPIAMFLAGLSNEGKKEITFKAAALGTKFFFEEAAGVTVYDFIGADGYRKETFLKGYTLKRALKKYGGAGLGTMNQPQ